MLSVSEFLSAIEEISAENPSYRKGGSGFDERAAAVHIPAAGLTEFPTTSQRLVVSHPGSAVIHHEHIAAPVVEFAD